MCKHIALFAVGIVCLNVGAADWPQWRGPQRDGVSQETGLLKAWPADGPKMLWKAGIGAGYSTPAIAGDRIYVISNEGSDNEFIQALSVHDGSKIWSERLGKVGPNQLMPYPGARSTPTVDGSLIYALGSDGDLACLETSEGKVRWRKNLRSDFGGTPGAWAYAESPLVDGDLVVCTPGGPKAALAALDKRTGDVVWESAVPGGDAAAYASIIPVEHAGKRQYVQFLGKGVVGVDARSGKFLWRYDRTAQGSPANIPTPVAAAGLVYSATNKGGAGLIKLKGPADAVEIEQVYYQQKLPTAIGGAVLVDRHLYGTNGQVLMCVEFATGTLKWEERSIAPASLCYAEGRLYLHGENGMAALVEASPEGYREQGKFTPPAGARGKGKAWAYPAIANGRLYLRDADILSCYDIKAAK